MNSSDETQLAEHAASSRPLPLIFCLRLLGCSDLLALIAVIMPLEWMSRINELCGLEAFPDSRIIGYLTRTTSALYAVYGALMLFISCDVVRYRPLIGFMGIVAFVHGIVLLAIDICVGMPLFWTILEGPAFAAMGLVVLWLQMPKNPTDEAVST
jgi:hypothetical protein